jgi:hypothetical protein
MEAHLGGCEFYGNGSEGVYWNGPHDSMWANCVAHENGAAGFRIEARGNGVEATNCHSWGASQTYAWYINGTFTHLVNCQGEGASTNQVYIGTNDNSIVGGVYYAAGGATTGIILGVSVSGNVINTKTLNFTTAAVALGANDAGGSAIQLNNYATSGTSVTGTLAGGATGNDVTFPMSVQIPAADAYKIGSDVSFFRNAANQLRTNNKLIIVSDQAGALEVFNPTAGNDVFQIDASGRIFSGPNSLYFRFYSDNFATITLDLEGDTGKIKWGSALDTALYRGDAGVLKTDGGFAVGQSATAPVLATSGTITTSQIGAARVAPTGNVTGVILGAGTVAGQTITVVNEAAFSITMAAAATSHVADGVSTAIAANTAARFIWDSSTSLWYHCK